MTEPTQTPAPKAAKAAKAKPSGDIVKCRVTKAGDGKISTGDRDEDGDLTHQFGAIIELPRDNAQELEDRHFVEIQ